ncbi:thioredoxin family protein, partial [Candidatus Woesearchaeota archaeon]|nr:thioredoxin family protein [Candidatus Woesearchaeota archaeon]
VFEEVSNELEGFLYLKVNTDNAQGLARRYNIRSIPTIVVLRGGIELERFTGVFNKEQFIEKLKKFID